MLLPLCKVRRCFFFAPWRKGFLTSQKHESHLSTLRSLPCEAAEGLGSISVRYCHQHLLSYINSGTAPRTLTAAGITGRIKALAVCSGYQRKMLKVSNVGGLLASTQSKPPLFFPFWVSAAIQNKLAPFPEFQICPIMTREIKAEVWEKNCQEPMGRHLLRKP